MEWVIRPPVVGMLIIEFIHRAERILSAIADFSTQ